MDIFSSQIGEIGDCKDFMSAPKYSGKPNTTHLANMTLMLQDALALLFLASIF
jgi:hypothetical protein